MIPSLAERLRSATRAQHMRAEGSPFMQALLHGRLQRQGYGALLHNLHAVYDSLEQGLARHARHPVIEPLQLAQLARRDALQADLQLLLGSGRRDAFVLTTAAQTYVARLRTLSDTRPELLVAHAYVRYLGDLHGGQQLRAIVRASLMPPPMPDSRFYDFSAVGKPGALIRGFRDALNALPLDAAGQADVVHEAGHGFDLHLALFTQLETHCTRAELLPAASSPDLTGAAP